ncbi:hypothetical protein BH09ACT8_BH09ACT8_33950 [soil metagenome]
METELGTVVVCLLLLVLGVSSCLRWLLRRSRVNGANPTLSSHSEELRHA